MSSTHCIVCGKPKKIPEQAARPPVRGKAKPRTPSIYVDRTIYEADPYCSRACCEADQGLTSSEDAA